MTVPSSDLIRAAKAAARSMADRTTPFIFDEWYVAAFSAEVGRTLLKRKILGRNIVIFRAESGRVVALDDRCAHRSFPLSRGRLEGDTLVCGYHGFRYDTQGDCIQIPSQASCPKGIGVRNYAVIEHGPLIWIWMGNAESAAQSGLADQSWLTTDQWECSQGYFALRASYISLHENLMDLTHLSYLHARSFGTTDYALAPYQVTTEGNRFLLTRRVVPTRLPPVWARPTGILGDQAARIATSEFVSPGLHVVSASFYDSALPEAERQVFRIKTAHLPTPETLTSTHYFIVHGRDFALRRPDVTQFMHDELFSAFQEDVEGLQAIEQGLTEGSSEAYEISVASDSAAVQMRRYLKRRAGSPVTPPCSRESR